MFHEYIGMIFPNSSSFWKFLEFLRNLLYYLIITRIFREFLEFLRASRKFSDFFFRTFRISTQNYEIFSLFQSFRTFELVELLENSINFLGVTHWNFPELNKTSLIVLGRLLPFPENPWISRKFSEFRGYSLNFLQVARTSRTLLLTSWKFPFADAARS